MHELSLAMEVIRIAERETHNLPSSSIQEISIEVGDLSGVEAEAFQSALEIVSRDSVLEGTNINIIRTTGTGICNACNKEFEMHSLMAACPECMAFPSVVNGGREFRVISLVIE